MTTKIIWRLKEQPTSESLRELVKDSILTKEEAREILFSQETEKEVNEDQLKSEIKFLRELVDKLSNHNNVKIVEVIKEVIVEKEPEPKTEEEKEEKIKKEKEDELWRKRDMEMA